MRVVIESFNKEIDSQNKQIKKISFSDFEKLSLAIAKKNGKKKLDLPCKNITFLIFFQILKIKSS